MDPLSVISGVASVTKAAALLASSLYGIISDIRNAPREMKDMASGIRELSDVLQELRTALTKGSGLFRMKLFRSIEVTTRRIEELHEDIRGLVRLDRGMSRMVWALRSKSRAEKLLGRIDSLKLGLLLNLKTITLILERDKQKRKGELGSDQNSDDGRDFHRMQLEMLVQTAKQSIRDAVSPPKLRDFGTQTDADPCLPHSLSPSSTGNIARLKWSTMSDDTQAQGSCTQIQKWDGSPDDSARLLYRLMFGDLDASVPDSRALQRVPISDLVLASESRPGKEVVDRMLLEYSYLKTDDFHESQDHHDDDLDRSPSKVCKRGRDCRHGSEPDTDCGSIAPSDSRSEARPGRQRHSAPKRSESMEPLPRLETRHTRSGAPEANQDWTDMYEMGHSFSRHRCSSRALVKQWLDSSSVAIAHKERVVGLASRAKRGDFDEDE